jgi:hypothetical protein
MLRLLADENFNRDILRGLLRKLPAADILLAQHTPMRGQPDPDLLQWAADNNRILLTHDLATIPAHAYARLSHNLPMPGVFLLDQRHPVGVAIDDLLLLLTASDQSEWNGLLLYLPL